MAVSQPRSVVRARGREVRTALTKAERAVAERLLIAHLQSLQVVGASSVGVFIAHDGEPDLMPLVQWLWANDQTVALPVLEDDPDNYAMRFVPWHHNQELRPGRYDIPVPPKADPVVPSTVLVSMTGFDRSGNRMGRGGGFFDRYLAATPANIVGVGFEVQRFDAVPVEAHDVSMPIVVTDLGVRFIE